MHDSEVRTAIKNARMSFWGVGLFSGVISILVLTSSLYMLQIYDRVLPSRSVPTLIGLTILVVFLYAAFGALDFARTRALTRIGLGIDRQLRRRVMDVVLHIPLRTKAGTDAILPIRDLDQIRSFLSGLGPTALFDMPWLPIYIAIIYYLHPWLGIFAIASASLLVALTILTEMRTKLPSGRASESGSHRHTFSEAAHRNAEAIRAMGMGGRVGNRWEELNNRFLMDQISMSDTANGIGSLSKALRLLMQSGILGLGAYLAIHGQLSPGALIAASIILSRALAPIEIAISNWKGFVGMRQSTRRLEALLSEIPPRSIGTTKLPRPVRTLEVRNLSIAPPAETLPTVVNVTFSLNAGDGLGIIGPSGAGKSTLVRALVGTWEPLPRSGNVRLDGATLDQWPPEALGRDIGYLPQDIELFDGTIAENIARLQPDIPSDAIISASEKAGAHDMIVRLPLGYETRLGDRGTKLSAGQRQRIGLARALFGDPFLIVLDEPNSNLDSHGEIALTHAIKSVRARGGIVVVVAHRPSALTSVNKALALDAGKVQAFGPRDDVLKSVLKKQADPQEAKSASDASTLTKPTGAIPPNFDVVA